MKAPQAPGKRVRRSVPHIVLELRTEDAMSSIRAATDDLDVGLVVSNAGGPLPGEFLRQSLDTLLGQVQVDATTYNANAGNRRGGARIHAAAAVSWRTLECRAVAMAVVVMPPALVR